MQKTSLIQNDIVSYVTVVLFNPARPILNKAAKMNFTQLHFHDDWGNKIHFYQSGTLINPIAIIILILHITYS